MISVEHQLLRGLGTQTSSIANVNVAAANESKLVTWREPAARRDYAGFGDNFATRAAQKKTDVVQRFSNGSPYISGFFASSRRAASSRHRYRLYTVRPSVCLAPAAKSSLIDRQNSDNTGTKLVVATLNKILARNFGSSFTIFVGRWNESL